VCVGPIVVSMWATSFMQKLVGKNTCLGGGAYSILYLHIGKAIFCMVLDDVLVDSVLWEEG
jgi:formiminotetrahydrofolate cyclodeaminase